MKTINEQIQFIKNQLQDWKSIKCHFQEKEALKNTEVEFFESVLKTLETFKKHYATKTDGILIQLSAERFKNFEQFEQFEIFIQNPNKTIEK